ncbi:YbfB/YjiJ family MFS transporter [Pseudomonas sp. SLFW]|uniref:YbfB/YjiJ family MFS transporter n=1 Tax=Pseudomonas sp. SLFW TaxID=2683259 RepID=UPI00141361DB|nr:YbfB/YjiJ family MFS transporter [Pseudomonas sp. SLFW]NBB11007.1 YbfB/YjiJ family MFS transporter [Pseudomonas sp. SLFW]
MEKAHAPSHAATAQDRSHNTRWGIAAGFLATLVGIGLARFAYTPLLPAIIDAGWFDASKAAYLGAANLAGYLIGALTGRVMADKSSTAFTLRAMMLLASVAFLACAFPVSYVWFFVWRLLSGISGGALMVLAAPAVLAQVSPAKRGLAGGIIFMGVGVGIAASGTLVPLLLQQGLKQTWLGLGLICLVFTALAWKGWPTHEATPANATHHPGQSKNTTLKALYAEYALNAAGWVPHMIFLVAFIAHGLNKGLEVGAQYWVLFGIGATLGPLLAGVLADRVGFGLALRLSFILEGVCVCIPALGLGTPWLMASSVVVGAFVTGTVPLVLGRVHELLAHHPAQQAAAWRTATVGFALFQAVAAYGFSYLFTYSGSNYALLFVIGTGAIALAFLIDIVAARSPVETAR